MKVYIVQESWFGDYGNGEILGVFGDKEAAEALSAEKNGGHNDIHEVEISPDIVDQAQAVLYSYNDAWPCPGCGGQPHRTRLMHGDA